ncbi:MAG: toll/interleukin-1 receptor domain-containing protein [Salegentibacter mishustinae]|nr:toll/interleukin-1 receptor domain-containing protein [Salegentibacter mishustinae]
MYKKVFISHAKEDYKTAEKIYDFLEKNDFSPWLDKKKIKLGSNWDYEIKKGLKESDFVILLLSSTSVKKRGYIQKEFKYALEYSESKLIDDIYILPILIDDCEVPDHLSQFQWIKMNEVNIQEKILESLNYQKDKYLEETSPEIIDINDYSIYSVDLKINFKNDIDYECNLPLFHTNQIFDADFVNTFIKSTVLNHISEIRKWAIEDKDYFDRRDMEFNLNISHSIRTLNEKNLSLYIVFDSFFGGAHPSTSIETLNFAFNPERLLKLRDVIDYNNLSEFLLEQIEKYGDEEQKESLPQYVEYLDSENLNFVFDENQIEIDFINILPRVIMVLGNLIIPRK